MALQLLSNKPDQPGTKGEDCIGILQNTPAANYGRAELTSG